MRKNAKVIASIFGLEDEIDAKLEAYDGRISALSAVAKDKNALVVMCSGGSFSLLGNDGRCSIIGTEIGFNNIGVSEETATATHGNEASFEYIVQADPDYMFVMDRDAAIGSDGAQLAKDVMENDLVKGTDVYKNGHIVYLENPGNLVHGRRRYYRTGHHAVRPRKRPDQIIGVGVISCKTWIFRQ